METRVANTETAISETSEEITLKASKTEVANTYATKTALNTTNTNVATAQSTANSAVTKADNAQADIDGLEIGGRNLLPNTNQGIKHWTYVSANGTVSIEAYEDVDGASCCKLICDVASTSWCYASYYMGYMLNKLLPNTEYTLSFDMLTNTVDTIQVAIRRGDGLKSLTSVSNQLGTINDEAWHKYVFKFTTNDLSEGIDEQVIYFSRFNIAGYKIIKNIKLEQGNRATDWTPAPEDIQNGMNELESRVTIAETSITQNSNAISLKAEKTEVATAKAEAISTASSDATTKANNALTSANSNTANLLKNYSTTAEMNSAIQLKADSITSSVSSTYATITSLNNVQNTADSAKDSIDNLEIGGRNLFTGYGDEEVMLRDYQGVGGFTQFTALSFDASDSEYIGKDFTISFWAKSPNGNTRLSLYNQNGNPRYFYFSTILDEALSTEWKYYQYTFTNIDRGENYTGNYTRVEIYANSQLGVLIKKLKVEIGNRATDWTPAPEYVDSKINSVETRVTSAESSITQLSNRITTNVTETTNLGTRMSTVEQTSSGLTTRLTTAESNILDAAKTATNYMNFSTSGLVIGDMTAGTLGENVSINTGSINLRNGTTILASFQPNAVYLGRNSTTSVINLCNGSATMRAVDDSDFKIYTDRRLVMSAYSTMLMDCWRDSTHMTRVSLQSADPDVSYTWGGISCSIYQGTIKNNFDLSGNTMEFKIENGSNTSRVCLDEKVFKVYAADEIRLSGINGVLIGEANTYEAKVTLGYSSSVAKSINCYWSDGGLHDLLSNASNGQNSYVGPGDLGTTTTTYVRGKYVRLYGHEGGGVYLGTSGSTAVTSDRNMKKDILDINDKYIDFFDRLKPITYKYNDGHRDHIGFIAQDVEEALKESGLTNEQFAGLVIEKDIDLNPDHDSSLSNEENKANEKHYDTLYSLRYEEFISLIVKKVQDLQRQLNEMKGE